MPHHEKHFSVQEARAWLPELRKRFERIHALYQELESLRGDYEKVQQIIRSNGHAPKETGFDTSFETRASELRALVQELLEAGIEIKDVGRGLIDFPHWRDGEEVYLCWQLSEDDIAYWHRIEDGFAGRQPLEE